MRISDWSSDVCSSDLFPHIGNVGANPEDMERGVHGALGAITRELPTNPSNFRSVQTLPEWMIEQGVIGLAGIDTRALTRRIRAAGAPNGVVAHSLDRQFDVDALLAMARGRSEERRAGKECGSTSRSRWAPYHYQTKRIIN